MFPTVIFRLHDEWLHAERVLRARAARRGYFFRQLKKRDAQLAAQLLSHGKACEVARKAPVTSSLVPVAMCEQGLSSQSQALEKQLKDHEVGSVVVGKAGRGVGSAVQNSSSRWLQMR